MSGKWTKVMQIDEAIEFVKGQLSAVGDKYAINMKEFEEASGVGIVITEADIQKMIDDHFNENKEAIDEKKWDFNFSKILFAIREQSKWADPKIIMEKMNAK